MNKIPRFYRFDLILIGSNKDFHIRPICKIHRIYLLKEFIWISQIRILFFSAMCKNYLKDQILFFFGKSIDVKKTTVWVEWEWQKGLDDMRHLLGDLWYLKDQFQNFPFQKRSQENSCNLQHTGLPNVLQLERKL